MKAIDIIDSEKVILKVKPGLVTTGSLDIIFMAKDIELDLGKFDLEKGDVEVDITNQIIKGKDNFVGIYGKLFPLPGKQNVELEISFYSNGEEVSKEIWKEIYCKIMFKLKA